MTTPTLRTDAYTEECRAAIDALEERFGIELVSIEHHEIALRELTAARAELAQERERAKRAEQRLADERAMHGLTLSRAERAEARAEAAEKDAGRYQWLRDESWKGINGTFAARWCLVANRGAGLDAAIDAIAEGKK